jgi:hypothetical protein
MEQATKNMEVNNTVNGVNVDELFGTIDAVKNTPVIAKFKFRAENQLSGSFYLYVEIFSEHKSPSMNPGLFGCHRTCFTVKDKGVRFILTIRVKYLCAAP